MRGQSLKGTHSPWQADSGALPGPCNSHADGIKRGESVRTSAWEASGLLALARLHTKVNFKKVNSPFMLSLSNRLAESMPRPLRFRVYYTHLYISLFFLCLRYFHLAHYKPAMFVRKTMHILCFSWTQSCPTWNIKIPILPNFEANFSHPVRVS